MSIPKHWTPVYLRNRLRELIFQKTHPDAPWLTPASVRLLEELLRGEHRGLEFGSGRSTAWLAGRCASLLSVEDNREWYDRVQATLQARNITNADCHLLGSGTPPAPAEAYLSLVRDLPDDGFDFILVDSEYHRDLLVNAVLPKLKSGGFLVVDNVNWFLPSASVSPHSRKKEEGAAGALWRQFEEATRHWSRTWTSSGVTDTAFFFKP